MSLRNGITTGLFGYTLKKEFLGEGLFFRETEVFNYDVQVTDFQTRDIAVIQNTIKSEFARYSGDINVKTFNIPADYTLPNDSVRIAKFNVQVEARRPAAISSSSLTATYYNGIDQQAFWNSYASAFKNFSEEFNYEKSDNGSLIASHSLNFTLITGDKSSASAIASYVYQNSDNAGTFAPKTNLTNAIGSWDLTTDDTQQIYNETYDVYRNNYSFNKRVEYPPLGSEASNAIKKMVKHVIDIEDGGIVTVSENGVIKAKKNFTAARDELATIKTNNSAFLRCSQLYTSLRNAFGGTSALTLVDLPTKNETVFNKPNLTVEYTMAYTDNPNVQGGNSTVEKILNVSTEESKYVTLELTYNYNRMTNTTSNAETENQALVDAASSQANAFVSSYYTSSPFFNSLWPTLTRIKQRYAVPKRKKNPSATFTYSNQPIYNVTLDGQLYKKLDFKISDTKPVDTITEFKVVNRPSKTSVINYAYQTEKGEKSIGITAVIDRTTYGNLFGSPPSFQQVFYPLYNFGVSKLLNGFVNAQALAFTYYLSDIKCTMNSEYEVSMSLVVTYTMKKYAA